MGVTQSTHEQYVLRTATKGSLRGLRQNDSQTGRPVCTRYTRIPYALPPIGDRRWKRPEPLSADFSFSSSRDGEPGDYTEFGNVCPQPVYGHGSVMLPHPDAAPEVPRVMSEDCLYLNIWVPAGEAPAAGWPVQFFIHGGWLQVGDAMQNTSHDPFDLLKDTPRIIVAPTYRLNLFGFMSCRELAAEAEDHAPGNYGFWDQRLALEWTARNIDLFGGNKDNISVGGLSAGAHSTIFQLHYDSRRPDPADRHIKRIFLFSNAVGIQPPPSVSSTTQSQYEELCTQLSIPTTSPSSSSSLDALRAVPADDLAAAISSLKQHTFRATTDGTFIPPTFLSSILTGQFSTLLASQNTSVLLGEVRDEWLLYRLVNPASSHESLITQINNYYPPRVTGALLPLYSLPDSSAPAQEWADVGAHIVADGQVHATVRGFAAALSKPAASASGSSPGEATLPKVYRYRICWRAAGMDAWVDAAAGLCHAADVPIWWQSGRRVGYADADVAKMKAWLRPFERFLAGEDEVGWGTEGKGVKAVREFGEDGVIRVKDDEGWERGLEVWGAMVKAQIGDGTVRGL